MEILANWNGQEMALADVRVPALDRAFLFGESIYEVCRVYEGKTWRFDEHLDRMQAGLLDLEIAFDVQTLRQRAQDTLRSSKLANALIYFQVTRGAGERHHFYLRDTTPNALLYVQPFDDPYAELRKTGASLISYPDIRWGRNDIKCTSLAANCMAAEAAHKQGAFEAALINNDNLISEGSRSSIFAVKDSHLIVAPSRSNVLPGITKKQILALCKAAAIPVKEGNVGLQDLGNLDEMFLTSTPEEIIGITKIDDKIIGSGTVGPLTLKLHKSFKEEINSWLKGLV